MAMLRELDHLRRGPDLRRHKRMFDEPVELVQQPGGLTWPMDDEEECPFDPPWPSKEARVAMERESSNKHPEEELGPLAKQWTIDLQTWYFKLQKHFGFDPSNLAANVYNSRHRWRARLRYLQLSDPEKFRSVMSNIEFGHKIPFSKPPKRFFRRRNPPSLAANKEQAWQAIIKDMAHGALRPVNLKSEGVPHCVCPVRTADKKDGTVRFVHNSRRVNKYIPKEAVQCSLESLMKTRNIYIPGGYAIGSDFASGYHCLRMFPEHCKYLSFALHVSELPQAAAEWLHQKYPASFMKKKGCFVFIYLALPFGLSSSCRAFNDLVTVLAGFWRRCKIAMEAVRASSYIDNISSIQRLFDHAMEMAIRLVYEGASLGLLFKIKKCSFFPRRSIKTLGTIVNLAEFTFSVSNSRALKITGALDELKRAVASDWYAVPARLIASFIGLIWSIAPCCYRAASVMLRAITAVLTREMRICLANNRLSLKAILNIYWSGTVPWTDAANRQLAFWSQVQFAQLSAPISADVLGRSAELLIEYPARFNTDNVSFLCQDASDTASGGGALRIIQGRLTVANLQFLAEFECHQQDASSTLREIMGVKWCVKAAAAAGLTKKRIVFLVDNWSAYQAILLGSSVEQIQEVAEDIFLWALSNGITCWPVWVPRTHPCIKEADRRSRLRIPHDDRSPHYLVNAANRIAVEAWGKELSFDQAASHRSAIRVGARTLPFNAFCMQPGASGVDMFRQWDSWPGNINYVYPPAPMTGRLVTFLPHVQAKAVVCFKAPVPAEWWSFAVQPAAEGVVTSFGIGQFVVVVFDFSTSAYCGAIAPRLTRGFLSVCLHPALSIQFVLEISHCQLLTTLCHVRFQTESGKRAQVPQERRRGRFASYNSPATFLNCTRPVGNSHATTTGPQAPTCPQVQKDLVYADELIAEAVKKGSWARNVAWVEKFSTYVRKIAAGGRCD